MPRTAVQDWSSRMLVAAVDERLALDTKVVVGAKEPHVGCLHDWVALRAPMRF
jgi:hypothetical protein